MSMTIQKLIEQGLLLQQQKNYPQAIEKYQKVLLIDKSNFVALHLLGLVFYQQDNLTEAESFISQSLKYNPDYVDALHNLALVTRDLNNPSQAEQLLKKAIAIKPQMATLHTTLAGIYLQSQDLTQAKECCHKALSLDPKSLAALNNLGNILRQQQQFYEAIRCYQKILSINPGYASAYNNLANIWYLQGHMQQAIETYHKALAIEPQSPHTHYNLATLYNKQQQTIKAIEHYQLALSHDPTYAQACTDLAALLKQTGKTKQAIQYYQQAIQLDPTDTISYRALSNLKTSQDNTHIETMETLLQELPKESEKATHLYFALARSYEKKEDYSSAFLYLNQGNQNKRKTFDYNISLTEALFQQIAFIFDQDFVTRQQASGYSSTAPIFIVGMPRSGTSLVEKIIASHSHVFGAGEITSLQDVILAKYNTYKDMLLSIYDVSKQECLQLGMDYVNQLPQQNIPISRIINKMPMNFIHLALIKIILPQAKIIHCARHPLDTCLSCYKQLFTSGQLFSYDLEETARYYMAYTRLMDHWRSIMANDFLDIRYEDLVARPTEESRRLIEYCELDWEDSCLTFYNNDHVTRTASSAQVDKPIYQDAIGRWQHYAPYLQPALNIFSQQGN